MSNIIPILKYFWKTVKHKWFILIIGLKLRVPFWRLIIHDLSKFSFKELPHYARQFYGDKSDQNGFIKAWIHHQNYNDHHFEYWIPRYDSFIKNIANVPVEIPHEAVKELVADWLAAGKVYEGKWPKLGDWSWFEEHFKKIPIHKETRSEIMNLLYYYEIKIR
jgi:hypothetical protein